MLSAWVAAVPLDDAAHCESLEPQWELGWAFVKARIGTSRDGHWLADTYAVQRRWFLFI